MLNRLDRRLFVKSIRNMRNAVMTHINRRAGREFIPGPRNALNIETSSICNLDCCFCAYPKKQSPRVVMSDDLFRKCVSQALELGYDTFDLTPCTGDVFMDRHLFDKLAVLDSDARVRTYGFFSNFTIPKASHIERLHEFKKMSGVAISVYGHDLASFKAITKSTDVVYARLVRNLELLLRMAAVVMYVELLAEADGEIVIHRLIVQKVFLDHVAAIAQAENEIPEPVMGIELHDVPQDGASTNLYQRFGPELRFFAHARA